MAWDVEFTDQFEHWWLTLTQEQQEALDDRVMLLAETGPGLKRPVVGDIKASRHPNMKELRASQGGALRVLFAFDPRRHAILLLGGDKSGEWKQWYRTAIPEADDLYDAHLQELTNEGLLEDPETGKDTPMPSTKSYSQLHDQVIARSGAAERLERLREETHVEIGLYELRRALERSQTDVAAALGISQSAVSQLERGGDLRISTLRSYLDRLGCSLQLVAVYDDGETHTEIPIDIGAPPHFATND